MKGSCQCGANCCAGRQLISASIGTGIYSEDVPSPQTPLLAWQPVHCGNGGSPKPGRAVTQRYKALHLSVSHQLCPALSCGTLWVSNPLDTEALHDGELHCHEQEVQCLQEYHSTSHGSFTPSLSSASLRTSSVAPDGHGREQYDRADSLPSQRPSVAPTGLQAVIPF